MSDVGASIESLYPGDYHGGSLIHRSICVSVLYNGDFDSLTSRIKMVMWTKTSDLLFGHLVGRFDGMEWLVSPGELESLLLMDVQRHMEGVGDTQAETKLQNPVTKNVFHRLARQDDFVAGIRFWDEFHEDGWGVGYRFRLAARAESDQDYLTTARARADEAEVCKTKLVAKLSIPEATYEEEQEALQRVRVQE